MRAARLGSCTPSPTCARHPCPGIALTPISQSDATIRPGSPLAKFIELAKPQTPEQRAELLERAELFASIHADAASTGQSSVPTDLNTDLHFTVFVQAPSPVDQKLRLVELDGRRAGPVDRGKSDDLIKVRLTALVIPVGVRP